MWRTKVTGQSPDSMTASNSGLHPDFPEDPLKWEFHPKYNKLMLDWYQEVMQCFLLSAAAC